MIRAIKVSGLWKSETLDVDVRVDIEGLDVKASNLESFKSELTRQASNVKKSGWGSRDWTLSFTSLH